MPSDRRALCVGINQFPFAPVNQLSGCVNDARDMADVFQRLVGFGADDVTILTDRDATKANIMGALQTMVNAARAGEIKYLVFSLSSHGTQVPDPSGEEPDRLNEAFCAADLAPAGQGGWDVNTLIVDDELRDLFLTLPADVLLEVYLDTCHSGTGLRGVQDVARFAPPPGVKSGVAPVAAAPRGLARGLAEGGSRHHILWSACRSEQTSMDTAFNGRPNGAFTYYWTQAMRDSQNALSRSQILQRVRDGLAAGRFGQDPGLQANATLS